MLLAGDVGGTKTDLAVYSTGSNPNSPVARKQFHSADYISLEAILTDFLADMNVPVERATFGVPGPVIARAVVTTNLPWAMDEDSLAAHLNVKTVHLMNDLEAIAWAIPMLRESDVVTLNVGEPVLKTTIAVIAPGTGLGESFLVWDGAHYMPQSSEGGHVHFAPTNDQQIRLLEYMRTRFEHVSVERVCSGIGIPNIYQYLRDVEHVFESPEITQRIAAAKDPTKAIADAALDPLNPSQLCRATMDMFVSILASETRNLALKVLATGGIYIAGGIAKNTLTLLENPTFMRAFTNRDRFSDLMKRIPIRVITTNAALIGAATHALEKSAS